MDGSQLLLYSDGLLVRTGGSSVTIANTFIQCGVDMEFGISCFEWLYEVRIAYDSIPSCTTLYLPHFDSSVASELVNGHSIVGPFLISNCVILQVIFAKTMW